MAYWYFKHVKEKVAVVDKRYKDANITLYCYIILLYHIVILYCYITLLYHIVILYCYITLLYYIVISHCYIILLYYIVISYCYITRDICNILTMKCEWLIWEVCCINVIELFQQIGRYFSFLFRNSGHSSCSMLSGVVAMLLQLVHVTRNKHSNPPMTHFRGSMMCSPPFAIEIHSLHV